mgnify:CR=1 FL=1
MKAKRATLTSDKYCHNCKRLLWCPESQSEGKLCVGVCLTDPPKEYDREDVVRLCVEELAGKWRRMGSVQRLHCTKDEAEAIGLALIRSKDKTEWATPFYATEEKKSESM